MNKFLKIVGIIVVVIVLFVILADNIINRENLNYVTKMDMMDAKKIKTLSANDTINVIMLSSTCPGRFDYTPKLKDNLKKLNAQNKPYYLIADELYCDKVDKEIADYEKEFGLKEKIYLLDKNTYKKNGGLFNNKVRYENFITELAGDANNIPLGYGVYLKIYNGKIISFNNTI